MKNQMKWLEFLAEGEMSYSHVNVEGVEAVADIGRYNVLNYTLATLEVFDRNFASTCPYPSMVRTALQWAEVAKGGSAETRKEWLGRNYNLSIHNLGSRDIYLDCLDNSKPDEEEKCIASMIRVHGTVGQIIRGEIGELAYLDLKQCSEILFDYILVGFQKSPKVFFKQDICRRVYDMLYALSCSVIGGVSAELLESLKDKISAVVRGVVGIDSDVVYTLDERLHLIKPDFSTPQKEYEEKYPNISKINQYSFWYPQVAMESLSDEIFLSIMDAAAAHVTECNCEDINFKGIADFLYYDYKGKKHINIYKKRILESLLCADDNSNHHICMTFTPSSNGRVLNVGYELSPTCEKLVDFCVEAERSGEISYEKAIVMLFDFFNFRKDSFDRLNNEDSYLAQMDDISKSRKGEILDYINGDSVVDVGSGSGVLLNLIADRYPNKSVTGTDISQEVIERLKKKAVKEGRTWKVIRHNFVDGPLPNKEDVIIFSSILHEIFSFTEINGEKFNPDSVKTAIKNAYASLRKGGRIIIRDGIAQKMEADSSIRLNSKDGMNFFNNFRNDFQGMPDYDRENIKTKIHNDENGNFKYYEVTANIDYIREFMYTFTWGESSYPQEVQEQFGYFSLKEFSDLIVELGAREIKCEEYFEKDYYTHLKDKLTYGVQTKEQFWNLGIGNYPSSNCIVVFEKPFD